MPRFSKWGASNLPDKTELQAMSARDLAGTIMDIDQDIGILVGADVDKIRTIESWLADAAINLAGKLLAALV